MKLFRRVFLIAILIVAGLWIRATFFPNPERAIRKRLTEIARNASTAPGEGNITGTAHAWRLANCFTTNTEFKIEWPEGRMEETLDRNEILRFVNGSRFGTGRSFRIEFLDPTIAFSEDKKTSTVEATLRATIPADKNFIVQEIKIIFIKVGREWLIQRVETLKTLASL